MTALNDTRPEAIAVATAPDGSLLYHVAHSPEALPPVLGRDLVACWDEARALARAGQWGIARSFRFVTDAGPTDLALADADAACWAEAVDARAGLHTRYGLSLCLRLLALVDWLARAGGAGGLVRVQDGEAELHPALVAAAARQKLNAAARFAGFETLAALAAPCEVLHTPEGYAR